MNDYGRKSHLKPLFRRKIEIHEPVQLAVDLLERMLLASRNEECSDLFCLKMFREVRRETLEDYLALAPHYCTMLHGMAYSEGMAAGRMLVMRILLGTLPAAFNEGCPQMIESGRSQKPGIPLHALQTALSYLKTLHLAERQETMNSWKQSVQASVKMLLLYGLSPYNLRRGGLPLLTVVLPYREQVVACYLPAAQTIVLYESTPALHHARRVYLFLHETGHAVARSLFPNRRLPESIFQLIQRLGELEEAAELLNPGLQGPEEIFANLFALNILHGTPEGKVLFNDVYRNIRSFLPELSDALRPENLRQRCRVGLQ